MSSTMLDANDVKVETNAENLEACRICLACNGKLYNIREWGLDTIFVELMGTTLSVWDGFPQHVCVVCRALLLKAHALRARCRRADVLLKQALMHQHFITNSFIRSVDRAAHNLTYTLSSEGGKVDVRSFEHDDTVTHTPNLPTPLQPLDFVTLIEHNIRNEPENDLKFDLNCDDIDDFHVNLETDKQLDNDIVQEVIDLKGELDSVNTEVLTEPKIAKQQIKTVKWKRKKPKKIETEKKVGKRKTDRRRKSITEEDFKEFEKKYNFQVQIFTEEEMVAEMEKRKDSNKYLKGTYKCDLCYNGFLTSNIYDNHMRTHDPARGDQECRLCHVRFNFPVKLRQHVQNAHRLKFRCAKCGEVVRGKPSAVLHAAYHAGTTFQCAHCDKQFLKKTSRTSHMRASHPVENAAGGTCELCGETFTSRTGLKSHKTRSHKKISSPALRCRRCAVQFDNLEAIKRHRETRPDKKCDPSLSACESCGETCASADELIKHRHQQHNVELFTCDTCTKSFTSKDSLATHIDRIHRNVRPPKMDYSDGGRRKQDWLHWASVCEHCGKRLSDSLATHIDRIHRNVRPPKMDYSDGGRRKQDWLHWASVCEHCGKRLSDSLATHIDRIHRNVRPPKMDYSDGGRRKQDWLHWASVCEHCGKRLSDSLATHIDRIHRNVRPPKMDYSDGGRRKQDWLHWASVCEHCGKRLSDSLATHIDRIHRNVRPPKMDYSDGGRRKQDWLHWASVCEHCGKRLSCRATLKIHMNKHTGERPYKCTLCPKAYMTPYGLNNHQAFHTGVRKWRCGECPATFMHQSSVYVHRKIHTGERPHQCTICDKYFTQSGSLYTHVKYVHMKETPPPRKRNRKTAA